MTKSNKRTSNSRKFLTKKRKSPLFLALGGVIILLIAAFFAFQKKPVSFTPEIIGNPSLNVDKEMIDLGDVKLGNTVHASFEVTNVGDQPLKFTKVPYIEVKEGC